MRWSAFAEMSCEGAISPIGNRAYAIGTSCNVMRIDIENRDERSDESDDTIQSSIERPHEGKQADTCERAEHRMNDERNDEWATEPIPTACYLSGLLDLTGTFHRVSSDEGDRVRSAKRRPRPPRRNIPCSFFDPVTI